MRQLTFLFLTLLCVGSCKQEPTPEEEIQKVLDDINTWKGLDFSWRNIRWTGVLEKREGQWKIVQMHFSFPLNY